VLIFFFCVILFSLRALFFPPPPLVSVRAPDALFPFIRVVAAVFYLRFFFSGSLFLLILMDFFIFLVARFSFQYRGFFFSCETF